LVAVVVIRNEFVPASGSVMAKHIRSSPVVVGVTNRRAWSSLPCRRIASRAKAVSRYSAMGMPCDDIASIAATTGTMPEPDPPYSSGTPRPSRPWVAIASQSSSGNRSVRAHFSQNSRSYLVAMPAATWWIASRTSSSSSPSDGVGKLMTRARSRCAG
jgi:hypothetical protein